jgi:hypothetical protein
MRTILTVKKFLIRIHARNLLIAVEGRGNLKYGFYTNRFVEAKDESSAANVAIAEIQSKPSVRERIINPPNDPPRILVDNIIEVSPTEDISKSNQGLIWYADKDAS